MEKSVGGLLVWIAPEMVLSKRFLQRALFAN